MDQSNAPSETPTAAPQRAQGWQKGIGLVVIGLSGVFAVAALIHGVARVLTDGFGGIQLPGSAQWAAAAETPAGTLMLATEMFASTLAVWTAVLCLTVALIAWGLPRLFHLRSYPLWVDLFAQVIVALFALMATVIGTIAAVSNADQRIMFLGVSLAVAMIPIVLGGITMLVVAVRRTVLIVKALPDVDFSALKKKFSRSAKPAKKARPTEKSAASATPRDSKKTKVVKRVKTVKTGKSASAASSAASVRVVKKTASSAASGTKVIRVKAVPKSSGATSSKNKSGKRQTGGTKK